MLVGLGCFDERFDAATIVAVFVNQVVRRFECFGRVIRIWGYVWS
jgi:hypothetical protein